jgi:putative flippase GtrA
VGLGLNTAIVSIGARRTALLLAQLLAIVIIVLLWNFPLNRLWTFRPS